MNTSAIASVPSPRPVEARTPVLLRGTGRGLEIVIDPRASIDEVIEQLNTHLAAAPGFFAGSDVTLLLPGTPLPVGALTRIEAVTARFGLRIAEVRTATPSAPRISSPSCMDRTDPPGTARFHVGPVRSGVVLEAPGDLVILGDVNPGAEVRAGGSITVMGSLRGIAHAACTQGTGFIVALRLEAQQLRIGALIARGGDGPNAALGAEIAYASGGQIVVESYQGRLPAGLNPSRR